MNDNLPIASFLLITKFYENHFLKMDDLTKDFNVPLESTQKVRSLAMRRLAHFFKDFTRLQEEKRNSSKEEFQKFRIVTKEGSPGPRIVGVTLTVKKPPFHSNL